jgi:hypothetical protein
LRWPPRSSSSNNNKKSSSVEWPGHTFHWLDHSLLKQNKFSLMLFCWAQLNHGVHLCHLPPPPNLQLFL